MLGQELAKREGTVATPRQMTVMEQLEARREHAVKQLEDVDKAIEVFKSHPEVEQALTALAQVGIYR